MDNFWRCTSCGPVSNNPVLQLFQFVPVKLSLRKFKHMELIQYTKLS